MNILVTGGGGFIGKALVKRLIEEGHTVTSLSRRDYPELVKSGAHVIRVDLLDKPALIKALANQEIVFHVAAKTGFWGPYSEYYKANVSGTLNIIDACRHNKVGHLVFTSSASVIFSGDDIEGGREDIPYPDSPISHYTETKAIAEKAVLMANNPDLKTISLRPHLVWGPGDRHILPRIIDQAKAGKLRIIGSMKNIVDTTYIDNTIEAHICTLKAIELKPEAWGKAYFISNDEPANLWGLVEKMLIAMGVEPPNKRISTRNALYLAGLMEKKQKLTSKADPPQLTRFLVHELTSSHWFDISAAKEYLGYKPIISIQEGLSRLAENSLSIPADIKPDILDSSEIEIPIDKKILSLRFLRKARKIEKEGLTVKSIRTAWNYLRKTSHLIKSGAGMVGTEAIETRAMAAIFFRMLENKLDLKNRKEPPSEEEVKAAINQLKDVGRFSLFATVSILPGGGFSLIGLELLARKFGITSFTLVPSAFRKKTD